MIQKFFNCGFRLRSMALAALLLLLALPAAAGSIATYPGVFSIDMQGTPVPLSLEGGSHGFGARSGGLGFVALFADVGYTNDDMQAVESVRKGMVRKSGDGQVTSINTLPGVGDAAEEFTLKLANGTAIRARVIKIGPRIFTLSVSNRAGDDLPVIWDLFFGSFRAL